MGGLGGSVTWVLGDYSKRFLCRGGVPRVVTGVTVTGMTVMCALAD
jgi:hypothetical protein